MILAVALSAGCAGSSPSVRHPESPEPQVVDMEDLRIQARQGDAGIEFETYDASQLFERAATLVEADQCAEGVELYDRLVEEFPHSRFVSSALYNAGLCLREAHENAESVLRFERLLAELPDSPDRVHSSFMLAELYLRLERWGDARRVSEQLAGLPDLRPAEHLEAMARRAQALLGAHELDEARTASRSALRYARRRGEDEIRNTFFTAAANYVYAETMRLRAADIEVPPGTIETQHDVLNSRAQLVIDAQREYFNTMRFHHSYWSAAAGYRIGSMYDAMWTAIDTAPVTLPDEDYSAEDEAYYREVYRERLRHHIKPLLRHSIRYWELTLLMVERTGVQTEWTADIRRDLERVRALLAAQPDEGEETPAGAAVQRGAIDPETASNRPSEDAPQTGVSEASAGSTESPE